MCDWKFASIWLKQGSPNYNWNKHLHLIPIKSLLINLIFFETLQSAGSWSIIVLKDWRRLMHFRHSLLYTTLYKPIFPVKKSESGRRSFFFLDFKVANGHSCAFVVICFLRCKSYNLGGQYDMMSLYRILSALLFDVLIYFSNSFIYFFLEIVPLINWFIRLPTWEYSPTVVFISLSKWKGQNKIV